MFHSKLRTSSLRRRLLLVIFSFAFPFCKRNIIRARKIQPRLGDVVRGNFLIYYKYLYYITISESNWSYSWKTPQLISSRTNKKKIKKRQRVDTLQMLLTTRSTGLSIFSFRKIYVFILIKFTTGLAIYLGNLQHAHRVGGGSFPCTLQQCLGSACLTNISLHFSLSNSFIMEILKSDRSVIGTLYKPDEPLGESISLVRPFADVL